MITRQSVAHDRVAGKLRAERQAAQPTTGGAEGILVQVGGPDPFGRFGCGRLESARDVVGDMALEGDSIAGHAVPDGYQVPLRADHRAGQGPDVGNQLTGHGPLVAGSKRKAGEVPQSGPSLPRAILE